MDARPIHRDEEGFPTRLLAVADPPSPLWIRGHLAADRPAVALVGARAASASGMARARQLAAELAEAGVEIVSGGALGIDAAAHRGALDARGGTVAVLGTGIDITYPERNAALFAEIVDRGGALVSQFAPGAPPRRRSFPLRNTVIAGLSDVLVVVEAGAISGTRHTVRAMRALGRPVTACPGSSGAEALLLAGAPPVTCAADVLAVLAGKLPPVPALPDDPVAARLYAALDEVPRDVGELAFRAGLALGTCAATMVDLELGGLCARAAGGRYLRLR